MLDVAMVFGIDAEKFFADDPKKLNMILGTLNQTRFEEIVEERLAMGKCANLFCKCPEIAKNVKESAKARLFFVKDKQLKKIGSEPLLFCRGSEADFITKHDECKAAYDKLSDRITNPNEGGPFGTPMRDLLDFLRSQLDHPQLHEIDKRRILAITDEFDSELAKVATPKIVEKRVV